MEDFCHIFEGVEEPRRSNATRHDLHEMLMIGVLATLCGGEGRCDMALLGREKEAFLRRFMRLDHGIASHDAFSDLFNALDPASFLAVMQRPVEGFAHDLEDVIAIDGKALRRSFTRAFTRSFTRADRKDALTMVQAIATITATREINGAASTATRHYISSLALTPDKLLHTAHSHWAIENSLHWVLDVAMNEDSARNRTGNGPENLALLRRIALNLARAETSKGSMRGKLKRAAWNDDFIPQSHTHSTAKLKSDCPVLDPLLDRPMLALQVLYVNVANSADAS